MCGFRGRATRWVVVICSCCVHWQPFPVAVRLSSALSRPCVRQVSDVRTTADGEGRKCVVTRRADLLQLHAIRPIHQTECVPSQLHTSRATAQVQCWYHINMTNVSGACCIRSTASHALLCLAAKHENCSFSHATAAEVLALRFNHHAWITYTI